MRRVPLKTVDITDALGRETKLPYLEIFEQLVKTSERGLTAAEMDTPLAIGEALAGAKRSAARSVILEEPEWSYLAERAKGNRWPFASPVFQQLIADVEGAEKVDPNATASIVSAAQ
jgi:hypothetical protein